MAIVMAVAQEHMLGRAKLGEPLEPLGGKQGIDGDPLGLEVVTS